VLQPEERTLEDEWGMIRTQMGCTSDQNMVAVAWDDLQDTTNLLGYSVPMMGAVHASETSVYSNKTTQPYILEDAHLHTRHREEMFQVCSQCLQTPTSQATPGYVGKMGSYRPLQSAIILSYG
jgi:hypothetical protein